MADPIEADPRALFVTECCGVSIAADHRFCPKCGYEARVTPSAPRPASAESFGLDPRMQPVVDELRRRMHAGSGVEQRAHSEQICPHCHLPAVLPDTCTPAVNDAIEERIASDGDMFIAGYFAAKRQAEGWLTEMRARVDNAITALEFELNTPTDIWASHIEDVIAKLRTGAAPQPNGPTSLLVNRHSSDPESTP